VKLRVTYHRRVDLDEDDVGQFQKGGLLVRVPPPPELALFDQVELELVCGAESITLMTQVVQTTTDALAVMFDRTKTQPFVAAAVGDDEDLDPEHERGDTAKRAPEAHGPQLAKQIQQALHGNKDERAAIIRGVNKQLHPFVLKNPQLGADEVLGFAKMATIGADLLAQIAARRDWAARPDIAIALVRNPKISVGVAVKLLEHVAVADLRQLAKDSRTRTPIQQAARKRVI